MLKHNSHHTKCSWKTDFDNDIKQENVSFCYSIVIFLFLMILGSTTACNTAPSPTPTPTPPTLATELTLYNWADDLPQSILDQFTETYGVPVNYVTYDSQEEAIANIKSGQAYDVVVLNSNFVTELINEELLAKLNQQNIPNIVNISANFIGLLYDPELKYSVPYNWGTNGLLVRTDVVTESITQWDDLWNPKYAGQVAIWGTEPRELMGIALKSLGYSANSEDPAELEAALEKLLILQQQSLRIEDFDDSTSVPLLNTKQAVIAHGYAYDVLLAQEEKELRDNISYILPDEGTILWGDNFVIPKNSPHQYTAELFLNFTLQPEIAAQIVNENLYATANVAAYPHIDPEILNNPIVFPNNDDLKNGEVVLPLSDAATAQHAELWKRFLAAE